MSKRRIAPEDAVRRLEEIRAASAERASRYAERMAAKGYRQRKFWILDEEYEALRQRLEEIRAAHAGDSSPGSA